MTDPLECHGCDRPLTTDEAVWIRPFGGAQPGQPGSLTIIGTMYLSPEDGAVAYCRACAEELTGGPPLEETKH